MHIKLFTSIIVSCDNFDGTFNGEFKRVFCQVNQHLFKPNLVSDQKTWEIFKFKTFSFFLDFFSK